MTVKNIYFLSDCFYSCIGLSKVIQEISPPCYNFIFNFELVNLRAIDNSASVRLSSFISILNNYGLDVELIKLTKQDDIKIIRTKLRSSLNSCHISFHDNNIINKLSIFETQTVLLTLKGLSDYDIAKNLSHFSSKPSGIKKSLQLKFGREINKHNIFTKALCVLFISQ